MYAVRQRARCDPGILGKHDERDEWIADLGADGDEVGIDAVVSTRISLLPDTPMNDLFVPRNDG